MPSHCTEPARQTGGTQEICANRPWILAIMICGVVFFFPLRRGAIYPGKRTTFRPDQFRSQCIPIAPYSGHFIERLPMGERPQRGLLFQLLRIPVFFTAQNVTYLNRGGFFHGHFSIGRRPTCYFHSPS